MTISQAIQVCRHRYATNASIAPRSVGINCEYPDAINPSIASWSVGINATLGFQFSIEFPCFAFPFSLLFPVLSLAEM